MESDQPQVTVNQRFEVFFPERRPFFLENADFFRTPINLIFTRRILDPQKGIRSTGKLGAYAVGAMLIDDEAPGKIVSRGHPLDGSRAGHAIARVNRDLGRRSTLGGLYVGREHEDGFNRVAALDGLFRFGDHWSASFQAIATETRLLDGTDASGPGYGIDVSRQGRQLNYFGSYRDYADGFRAETGFVPRTGIRDLSHFLSYFFRPESTLVFWGPELYVRRVWDRNGLRLDDVAEASLEWHFTGQTSFEVNHRSARERLRPEEFPALGENRDFDTGFWNVEYDTAFSDAFNLSGDSTWGGQVHIDPLPGIAPFRVDWRGTNLFVSLRLLTSLRIDDTYLYTRLSEPASGDTVLSDHILRTGWNWQLNRELSLRVILQYEATLTNPDWTSLPTRKNVNGDILLTYRVNPFTAVYAGYNGNGQNIRIVTGPEGRRIVHDNTLFHDASQLFFKVSYLVRF